MQSTRGHHVSIHVWNEYNRFVLDGPWMMIRPRCERTQGRVSSLSVYQSLCLRPLGDKSVCDWIEMRSTQRCTILICIDCRRPEIMCKWMSEWVWIWVWVWVWVYRVWVWKACNANVIAIFMRQPQQQQQPQEDRSVIVIVIVIIMLHLLYPIITLL